MPHLSERLRSALWSGRLFAALGKLRESFWFMPGLMTAGAIVLSVALTRLDAEIEQRTYRNLGWLYLFGPEGARAILSAIAGSMITVAGLTFSITMLTLQLATSQFGPRLLRNFMRDRGNQLVLGTFIATFVYCLMVLRTVKGVEGSSFVPHIAVATGILLSIASLAVLIYFIHHTAYSIRLETILGNLARETHDAIDRLFPEALGEGQDEDDGPPERAGVDDEGGPVCPKKSGYVQLIDGKALMRIAVERDVVVEIVAGPGAFVMASDRLMTVQPAHAVDDATLDALRAAVVLGDERTPAEDVAFSMRRIVEIAQRALSPSVNDPTTAIYCIHRLSEALDRLASRKPPAAHRLDDSGRLRVIARPITFAELASGCLDAVARYGKDDADVVEALRTALDRLMAHVGPHDRAALAPLRESLPLRTEGGG